MIHLHIPKHRLFYLQKPLGGGILSPKKDDKVVTLADLGNKAVADFKAYSVGESGRVKASNNIRQSETEKPEAIAVGLSHKNSEVIAVGSGVQYSNFQESSISKPVDNSQIVAEIEQDGISEIVQVGQTTAIGIGQSSTAEAANNVVQGPRSAAARFRANVAKLDIQSFAKTGANVSVQDYPTAKWNYVFDKQKDLKVRVTLTDEQAAQLVNPRTKSLNKIHDLAFFCIINGTRKYFPKPTLNSDGRSYYLYLILNSGPATKRRESRLIYIEDQANPDRTQFAIIHAFLVRLGVKVDIINSDEDSKKSFAGPVSDVFEGEERDLDINSDGNYTTRVQTNAEIAENENRAKPKEEPKVLPELAVINATEEELRRLQETGSLDNSNYSSDVTGLNNNDVVSKDVGGDFPLTTGSGNINVNSFAGDVEALGDQGDQTSGATGIGVQNAAVGVGAITADLGSKATLGIGAGSVLAAGVGGVAASGLHNFNGATGALSVLAQIKQKREAKQQGFGLITDKAGFEINQSIASALAEGRHEEFHFGEDGSVVHKETGQTIRQGSIAVSGDGQVAQFGLNSNAFESSNQDLRDFVNQNNTTGQFNPTGEFGGFNVAAAGASAIPFASAFLGSNPTFVPGQSSAIEYYNSGNFVNGGTEPGQIIPGRVENGVYYPPEYTPPSKKYSDGGFGSGSGNGGKPPRNPRTGGNGNNNGSNNGSGGDSNSSSDSGDNNDDGAFGEGLSRSYFPTANKLLNKFGLGSTTPQSNPDGSLPIDYNERSTLQDPKEWLHGARERLRNMKIGNLKAGRFLRSSPLSREGVSGVKAAGQRMGTALNSPASAQSAIAAVRAAGAAISAAFAALAPLAPFIAGLLIAVILFTIMVSTLIIAPYCVKADPFPEIRNNILEPAMWAGAISTANPLEKAGTFAKLGFNGLGAIANGSAAKGEGLLPPSEFRKTIETALACKDKGADDCAIGTNGVVSGNNVPICLNKELANKKDEDTISFWAANGSRTFTVPIKVKIIKSIIDNAPDTDTAAFVLSLVATEAGIIGNKDPADLWALNGGSGSDYIGPAQVGSRERASWGERLGGYKGDAEFKSNAKYQMLIIAIGMKEKKGSYDPPISKAECDRQRLPYAPRVPGPKSDIYKIAYAWNTLCGKDGADTLTDLYAQMAEKNYGVITCQTTPTTANLDPLNSYFKDQRAQWQKTRDDYFGKVFGIPVSVTDGKKQAKASGIAVIDNMMRAFNAEMKGGLTVEAQTTGQTVGDRNKLESNYADMKTKRSRLAQLYKDKLVAQVGNSESNDGNFTNPTYMDQLGAEDAFSENTVLALLKLYDSGITWVSGPWNATRGNSKSGHESGEAIDFWGFGYTKEFNKSAPIRGFNGPIRMHASGELPDTPIPSNEGNKADPRIFRIIDLSSSNSELKSKIIKIFDEAYGILKATKVATNPVGHDEFKKAVGSKYPELQGHGGQSTNGHHNHLHVGFFSKSEYLFDGSGTSSVNGSSGSGYLTDGKKCCKCTKSGDPSGKVDSAGSFGDAPSSNAKDGVKPTKYSDLTLEHRAFLKEIATDKKYGAGGQPGVPVPEYKGELINVGGEKMNKEAGEAFLSMQSDAKKANITLNPVSGYRNYDDQVFTYFNPVGVSDPISVYFGGKDKDNSAAKAQYLARAKHSAPIGYSEHHTGNAVDIDRVNNSFEGTPEFNWLNAIVDGKPRSQKYGFEMSYPKNSPTGANYESWHYQYKKELKKTSWLQDIIQKGLSFNFNSNLQVDAQTATSTATPSPATPNPQPGPALVQPSSGNGNCPDSGGSSDASGGGSVNVDLANLTKDQAALALIAILEGGPNNLTNQLDVAQVIANRVGNNYNSFGKTIFAQVTAGGQFAVIPENGVDMSKITSGTALIAELKRIKQYDATSDVNNFFAALKDSTKVKNSADFVGIRANFKSANGALQAGEVQRDKNSNFFHYENGQESYKQINIASVIGGSTGTENIATKPADTKPAYLPNWLTGNLRVEAQVASTAAQVAQKAVGDTIADNAGIGDMASASQKGRANYYRESPQERPAGFDFPPEGKIYTDKTNKELKVGDKVKLAYEKTPSKIYILEVAKAVDLKEEDGTTMIRLSEKDFANFGLSAATGTGGKNYIFLYSKEKADAKVGAVLPDPKDVAAQANINANCVKGITNDASTISPTGWVIPAPGTDYTSGPGPRWGSNHKGIDMAGPLDTPVLAANIGKVIDVCLEGGPTGCGLYGTVVTIDHGNGLFGNYAHMEVAFVKVKVGQEVKAGDRIGGVGSQGRSSGPHLHFEIRSGSPYGGVEDPCGGKYFKCPENGGTFAK
jgi:murein DD-endopeptidase MepM/ murein hydrolase activator NlpD